MGNERAEAGWTGPGMSAQREVLRMAASVMQSHVQARGHAWTWSSVDWDHLVCSFIHSFIHRAGPGAGGSGEQSRWPPWGV